VKRITTLELDNFRAFFGKYLIDLPKGENLLIYGENGSGKSSLFKSVNNFLSSSRNPALPYIKHHNRQTEEGNLSFTFKTYDPVLNTVTSNVGEVINFNSNTVTTGTSQFVKGAELTKGFLDYRSLLEVYNHKEAQPNLFRLIIIDLLRDFIPTGLPYALGSKFLELSKNLKEVYNRNEVKHKRALAELPAYEIALRAALKDIFLHLNGFLIKYFKLNLRVWFSLQPLSPYNYEKWQIPADLRLELKLHGVSIQHQSDYLNEARLSALSICLYLAAAKRNPQILDFKVVFLDDVFVGLDTTNRIPILEILKHEFKDYQVFISTYDRHLYELAKRKFETEVPGKWKSVELYVGKDRVANQPIDKPILVVGDTNFEKGSQYLHDRKKPDYPASANYFRKTLEELIKEFIPPYETVDSENTNQIPEYKLGPLIYRAKRFLDKTGNNSNSLNQIIALLPALLHPLSHHEITSPVYKGELLLVENHIPKLISELRELDIKTNYKCSPLEGRNKIKLKFIISAATGHFSFYELRTTEPLVLKHNPAGQPFISNIHCFAEKVWGENNGTLVPRSSKEFTKIEREQLNLNFTSLKDAYDRLHAKIIQYPAIGNFPKSVNYLDDFEYLDQQGNYKTLNSALVW